MFQVTVDSTACLLLNEAPDLAAAAYILRKKRKWVSEIGRTALEERRALVQSDVASVAYTIFVEGAEGGDVRRALRDYDMRPVLVPFWPGEGRLAEIAASRWSSGLRIFFEPDWSAFEIRNDGASAPTSFAPSDDCSFAPLLWCAFETLPKPRAVSGALMEVPLELVETGLAAYAIDPAPGSILFGPSVGTTPRLILPGALEWSSLPKAGGVDYLYERTAVGYVRQPVDKYAPQTARRRLEVHLAYDADDLARLLRLWMHSDGPVNSWWCEGAYAETVLVSDTSAVSTEIEVEDAGVFSGENYICFVGQDGRLTGRRIVSTAGNILTLDSAPGVFSAAATRLTPLLMVRFVKEVLRIDWKRGWGIAEIDAELVELPTETEPGRPAGESLGGTLGPQYPHRYAYLVTDGGREPWRYTSGDRPLDLGALGVFEPRPIEHGEITQELNLEQHDCDLTVGWWEGNPFFEAQVDDAAPPLTVTIYEHTDDGVSAPVAIFTGQASLSYSDDICQATLRGPEAVLDTKVPVQVTSPRCWAPLYGAKCGLSRAALAVPARVDSANGTTLSLAVSASAGSGYFAGGYAERSWSDGRVQRFSVVQSGSASSGTLSVVLGNYSAPGDLSGLKNPAVGPSSLDTSVVLANIPGADLIASDRAGNIYFAASRLPYESIRKLSPDGTISVLEGTTGYMMGLACDSAGNLYASYESEGAIKRITPSGVIEQMLAGFPSPRGLVFSTTDELYFACGDGSVRYWWKVGAPSVDTIATGLSTPTVLAITSSPSPALYVGGGVYGAGALYKIGLSGRPYPITTYVRDRMDHRVGGLLADPNGDVFYTVLGWPSIFRLMANDIENYLHPRGLAWSAAGNILVCDMAGYIRELRLARTYYDVLTLFPGCDKSWARCQALDNSANFRGFPHMPKTNPAMVAVSNTTGSGSKK